MAMKDNKSITVAPSQRDDAVTLFHSFGWELKTEQEINKEAQQFISGSDDDYIYYETIPAENYVKLGFERDRGHQNYEELKSLEEQYYALGKQYDAVEKPYPGAGYYSPAFVTPLWVILIIVGLIAFIVPGVILLVIHIVTYIKKYKHWKTVEYPEHQEKFQKEKAEFEAKRNDLLTQREETLKKAQALV